MTRRRTKTNDPTSYAGRYTGKSTRNLGTVTREEYNRGQRLPELSRSGRPIKKRRAG